MEFNSGFKGLRKNGAIPLLPLLCLYGVDREIFTSLFVWGLYNKKWHVMCPVHLFSCGTGYNPFEANG